MKAWHIALILILVLAVVGGGFILYNRQAQPEASPLGPQEETVKVERGTIEIEVEASGNLTMPHQAKLSFGSSGTIKVLDVKVGDRVKKGQVLAELDTASLERAVAEAQYRLRSAKTNLEKVKEPYDAADIRKAEADVASARANLDYVEAISVQEGRYPEGLYKKSQVESAKAALVKAEEGLADILDGPDPQDVELAQIDVEAAQLSLDEAKEQVEKSTILVPFDGIVAQVSAKLGARIMAAMSYETIILLIDPTQLEVEGLVDELDIFQVKVRQKVRIFFDASPGTEFLGTVKSISPVAQGEAGVVNYPVWIGVEPPADIVLSEGLTATVDIIVGAREDILLIPSEAAALKDKNWLVKVLAHGKIEERQIQIGLSNDRWTEVVEGLKEGEQVVVRTAATR